MAQGSTWWRVRGGHRGGDATGHGNSSCAETACRHRRDHRYVALRALHTAAGLASTQLHAWSSHGRMGHVGHGRHSAVWCSAQITHMRTACMQQQGLTKLAPTMCTTHVQAPTARSGMCSANHSRPRRVPARPHIRAWSLPCQRGKAAMPCRSGSRQPHMPGIVRGAHRAAPTRLMIGSD